MIIVRHKTEFEWVTTLTRENFLKIKKYFPDITVPVMHSSGVMKKVVISELEEVEVEELFDEVELKGD
jgi:hypothetical protein